MGIRKICPQCGSNTVSKILYGLIDSTAFPILQCNQCKYEWGGRRKQIHRSNLSRFKASIGGHFGPCYEVSIDMKNSTLSYSQIEDRCYKTNDLKQTKLTEKQLEKLLHLLDYSDFIDWKERYSDTTILDGTHWEVEVELTDGSQIVKSGSNSYPGKWRYYCEKVSELVGDYFK